jgi:endonuclease G, mitochondrial
MTNILPQTATLNRSAWLRTEEIMECYRDQTELLVPSEAIWEQPSSAEEKGVLLAIGV